MLVSRRQTLLSFRQLIQSALCFGDVMERAHAIEKCAGRVAHRRGDDRYPDDRSVFADDALLDRITVDLAGDEAGIAAKILLPIFRVQDIENVSVQQFLARAS